MNFLETNNFIVKHACEKHLLQDLELLKAKQPNHSLVQNSSSRLNFNKKGFDEEILLTLLEACGPEEILENRKKEPKAINGLSATAVFVDEVKSKGFASGITEVIKKTFPELGKKKVKIKNGKKKKNSRR